MSQVDYEAMPLIEVLEEDEWDELLLDMKINPVNETNRMGPYCMASAMWTQWELETGKTAQFEQFWHGEDKEWDDLKAKGLL